MNDCTCHDQTGCGHTHCNLAPPTPSRVAGCDGPACLAQHHAPSDHLALFADLLLRSRREPVTA